MEYIYSKHAQLVMLERGIPREAVDACIGNPDRIERRSDGTIHCLKQGLGTDRRWLRVVVNVGNAAPLVVTVFYDRRLRRGNEDSDR